MQINITQALQYIKARKELEKQTSLRSCYCYLYVAGQRCTICQYHEDKQAK